MTTSQYRKIANELADNLMWADAASFMEKAIEAYPSKGALADLDKARMQARVDSWRAMVAA